MSLLHADDLEGAPEGYRWQQYTVRVLVKKAVFEPLITRGDDGGKTIDEWFKMVSDEAETVDVLVAMPLGEGGRCAHCGLVTVNTTGYPWGETTLKQVIYCPHCDGGEDVG